MKLLNELLGFAVLTGPLWLILIILLLGIVIILKIGNRFKTGGAKLAISGGIFLLIFVILFGDAIVGRIYLNYLCTNEAGVKVYQTVELPAEYWDEEGKPKFFNQHGYLDHDFWVKNLDESGGHIERYSSILAIDKDTSPIRWSTSHNLLAEITTFRYWGGWLSQNFSPSNTATSCKFTSDPNFSRNFYSKLFQPLSSSK